MCIRDRIQRYGLEREKCTHIHTHTYTHMRAHTHSDTHIHLRVRTHAHVFMHTYSRTYYEHIYMCKSHTRAHTMSTYICVCTHTCTKKLFLTHAQRAMFQQALNIVDFCKIRNDDDSNEKKSGDMIMLLQYVNSSFFQNRS